MRPARPLLLCGLLLASLASAKPASPKVVICAVADFAVTGLQNPRYWLGYTYAELLTRRLRLAENLLVVEPLKCRAVPMTVLPRTIDELRARTAVLHAELTVPFVVTGLIDDRGDTLKITALVTTDRKDDQDNYWALEEEVPFTEFLKPQVDLIVRRFLPNMGLRMNATEVDAMVGWQTTITPELMELVGQGWRTYAPEQPEDAFKIWRQALALDPTCDLAGEALASAGYLYRRRLLETALSYYQQRLAQDPTDPMTNYHLGEIYADNAEWLNAERHFNMAMAGDKSFLDAYLGRISALLGQHRYEDAIVAALGTLQLFPDHSKVLHNLAVAYYRSGNIPEARNVWQRILAVHPEDTLAKERLATYGGGGSVEPLG